MNGALLALERGDEGTDHTEALTGIMRELHTLKGAGGSVNLEDVETLSHDLESVFGPILEGERELSHPIFAVAYRTLDAIGELIAAAVEERAAAVDVGALVTEMHDAADGTVAESPPPPDANPAGQGSADEPDADPTETVDHASLLRSFADLQEPAFGESACGLRRGAVGALERAARTSREPAATRTREGRGGREGSRLEPQTRSNRPSKGSSHRRMRSNRPAKGSRL